jgi:hypothetical protein
MNASWLLPKHSLAHAFDERYDLPLPLDFFIWGAVLTVVLTYLITIWFSQYSGKQPAQYRVIDLPVANPNTHLANLISKFFKLISLLGMVGIILIGLYGPSNPLMNLSSHFIWVNWWVGMPLLFVIFGPLLHHLNPFLNLAQITQYLINKSSFKASKLPLSQTMNIIGCWPAVFGILCWSWIEVIYPSASLPKFLAQMSLVWISATIVGTALFGLSNWQKNWDFFSIYFDILSSISPLQFNSKKQLVWQMPFVSLSQEKPSIPGQVGFMIAMLSSVLFDGLHSSPVWLSFDFYLKKYAPFLMDINGYIPGIIGVSSIWLFFYSVFIITCYAASQIALKLSKSDRQNKFADNSSLTAFDLAQRFSLSLIPIALAYHIAHHFSSLMIQGQNVIHLISDPFGVGWNLFGTSLLYPDITLVDAKLTWYVALIAIVLGHVIAIWLTHLIALQKWQNSQIASIASLPLTIVMIFYTALSLMILAEPLVN